MSYASPKLGADVARLGANGATSAEGKGWVLLGLIAAAPTLGSLRSLRSVRLTRLSQEPLAHFRLSNHLDWVLLYPIDSTGRAQRTGSRAEDLGAVQSVCIVELGQRQLRGVSA